MGSSGSKKSALETWESQVDEEVVEPEREIVDAHHHLWDPQNEPRGSLTSGSKLLGVMSAGLRRLVMKIVFPPSAITCFGAESPVINKFMADDLKAGFGGHNVTQSVAIQAQWHDTKVEEEYSCVSESKRLYESSLEHGFPQACSGYIDLRVGKERTKAAILKHQEANPMIRGFRHQLSWHEDKRIFSSVDAEEGLSKKENFRDGLKAIEEAGLVFELWCFHTQLEEMVELVTAFPGLTFVLNHIGTPLGHGPYKGAEGQKLAKEEWEQGIKAIAALPNIVVKLSGLLMPFTGFNFHTAATPPTSDAVLAAILPYYKYAFEQFGVDRCMFASNFPVDRVSCSYKVLFNAFKKLCIELDLSDQDKDKLFSQNARTVYKLGPNQVPASLRSI